ncbi:SH3 domain-containing protein [Marinobacterium iners]|uniref:SH3 domain-containing protein n=1 Tax=Marinobacterium iners DSM 11526 TaxID=1122198 RepID=A0A1H4HAN6_9GAMM|nr:SH3 domain-containing protein [Marinobacterium iners]SEB18869.1 hypothetical protein SAMN02745729_1388 [Marinobacterium iners DSM 11526]
MRYFLWIVFPLFLLLIMAYFYYWPEIIVLRAEEELALGESPVDPPSGRNFVTKLSSGDEVYVIDCQDIKTDFVLLVRTKNGDEGYIAGGEYALYNKDLSLSSLIYDSEVVVFSCRGMLENRFAN